MSGSFTGSTKDADAPVLQETPWAPEAREWLSNLLYGSGEAPMLQVPGMTGTEQQGQDVLQQILSGGTFEDPATSDFYKGFRAESQAEEERAVSQTQRGAQLSGMGASTGAAKAGGDIRSGFANNRLQMLGGLYDAERARDNPYTRLAAVGQYGGLPRQIEGQQGMAQFGQQMFPYEQQAPLAQQMLGYQPWYQPQQYYDPGWYETIVAPTAQAVGGGVAGGMG